MPCQNGLFLQYRIISGHLDTVLIATTVVSRIRVKKSFFEIFILKLEIQILESDPIHFTTKIENEIVPSMVHLNGHFLNKIKENIPSQRKLCCELSKDRLYSFKQNILYPYANVEEKNKQLAHANYTFKLHILCYIEQNGFSLL